MSAREDNKVLPDELKKFCIYRDRYDIKINKELIDELNEIVSSISHGIDPNDITMKNIIRDNLNKINISNFNSVIETLKAINYTSNEKRTS